MSGMPIISNIVEISCFSNSLFSITTSLTSRIKTSISWYQIEVSIETSSGKASAFPPEVSLYNGKCKRTTNSDNFWYSNI